MFLSQTPEEQHELFYGTKKNLSPSTPSQKRRDHLGSAQVDDQSYNLTAMFHKENRIFEEFQKKSPTKTDEEIQKEMDEFDQKKK